MKQLKLFTFILVAAILPLTACNDKEETPEVELAAISVDGGAMTFYAEGGRQRVTLSSEEDWSATCPDWISLSPASGVAGKTEVVIDVESNYDGQNPLPYRYGKVMFTGRETGSTAGVSVSQEGIETVSVLNLAAVNDGAEIYIPELVITSVFNGGFIALYTEEPEEEDAEGDDAPNEPSAKSVRASAEAVKTSIMVFTEEDLTLGDGISLTAIKSTMWGLPVLNLYSYSVLSTDNEVGDTDPTDISDVIDSYSFSQWELVKIRGIVSEDGNVAPFQVVDTELIISDGKSAGATGATEDVNLELLASSHWVYVTGYYVSTESNTVGLYVTEVEDVGLVEERVLYEDDYEWLQAWRDNGVGSGTQASASGATNADGQTVYAYMSSVLGYRCFFNDGSGSHSEGSNANRGWYIQYSSGRGNYLRWGVSSGKSYVIVPAFDIPSGEVLVLKLAFDIRSHKAGDEYETYRPDFRFEFLDAESEPSSSSEVYAQYYWDGFEMLESGEIEDEAWYSVVWDLIDEDLAGKVVRLGYGSGAIFDTDRQPATTYFDNAKLTWIGVEK